MRNVELAGEEDRDASKDSRHVRSLLEDDLDDRLVVAVVVHVALDLDVVGDAVDVLEAHHAERNVVDRTVDAEDVRVALFVACTQQNDEELVGRYGHGCLLGSGWIVVGTCPWAM